jgi:hypothetical protein
MKLLSEEFPESAKSAFNFLVSENGLDLVSAASSLVSYEGNGVFVNVRRRSTGEMDWELGRTTKPSERKMPYNSSEVAEAAGAADRAKHALTPVTTTGLRAALDELSRLLRDVGAEALTGDARAFDRLATVRDRRFRRYMEAP